MGFLSTAAAVGMAIGPPLICSWRVQTRTLTTADVDQLRTIIKLQDSSGFSKNVCGVLILASIARIYFWISARYEIALLVQAILLIIAQLIILHFCLRYTHLDPADWPQGAEGTQEQHLLGKVGPGGMAKRRPYQFWQWTSYGKYLEFTAGYIVALGVIVLVFQSFDFFWTALGFFATGLEATLPLPQLVINQRRKSLAGFSLLVLAGWTFGDAYKTAFFIIRSSPVQFTVCGAFQLVIDGLICAQAWLYREQTRLENQQALAIAHGATEV